MAEEFWLKKMSTKGCVNSREIAEAVGLFVLVSIWAEEFSRITIAVRAATSGLERLYLE